MSQAPLTVWPLPGNVGVAQSPSGWRDIPVGRGPGSFLTIPKPLPTKWVRFLTGLHAQPKMREKYPAPAQEPGGRTFSSYQWSTGEISLWPYLKNNVHGWDPGDTLSKTHATQGRTSIQYCLPQRGLADRERVNWPSVCIGGEAPGNGLSEAEPGLPGHYPSGPPSGPNLWLYLLIIQCVYCTCFHLWGPAGGGCVSMSYSKLWAHL
jgi:hypothetical protein